MLRRLIIVLFVLLSVVSAGCPERVERRVSEGAAPDFALQDLDGKKVSLSDFKGSVVIVNFWATWCGPCRATIPGLENLYRKYSPKGLVLLGISLDDGGWDYVKSFKQEYGISYPILKGNSDVASKYMVRTIPFIVIVGRDGQVHNRLHGFGAEEKLEKEIKKLL